MTLTSTAPTRGSAAPVVRRIVVYTILFVLVILVANGLGDLVNRLVELATATPIAGSATGGLAVALTFTLIGGPLAALLAWFAWRRLADRPERESLAWALYLVGMVTVSLVIASSSLLSAGASAVTGDEFTAAATTGLVWALVWAGHRFVLRRSARRPTRLPGTAAVLGGVYGLVVGAGGAITALTLLLDSALGTIVATGVGGGADAVAGDPWWVAALQALVWMIGGSLLWWGHWRHEGGRNATSTLAAVALVGVGILGGALLAVTGTGTVLFVLLRLAVDRSDPVPELVDPLPLAVAAAVIGGVIWVFHRGVVRRRPGPVRAASTLVTSGLSLVATATGVGVIVNALLAAVSTPLAADDPRTLLLGGISSVLVGGPLWWASWRPTTALTPERRGATGRSVYLVVVFGISAVVALITLLVIGFRLFDSVLSGDAGLLDRIRAPLGLLVATGLVAGYHFSVWRGDRGAAPTAASVTAPEATAPEAVAPIIDLVLVMGPGGEPVVTHLRQLTGARVTYWRRPDATAMPTPGQVVGALEGVSGERVLLIVDADGSVTVIPVSTVSTDSMDSTVTAGTAPAPPV